MEQEYKIFLSLDELRNLVHTNPIKYSSRELNNDNSKMTFLADKFMIEYDVNPFISKINNFVYEKIDNELVLRFVVSCYDNTYHNNHEIYDINFFLANDTFDVIKKHKLDIINFLKKNRDNILDIGINKEILELYFRGLLNTKIKNARK